MPNELQELQLRVSLINEASEGISRIRDDVRQLVSGSGKEAMDRLKEEQQELAKQIKELGDLVASGGEELVSYIGKFGVAGAAMGGLAATIVSGIGNLKEFSNTIVELTNKAKVIGMDPAELKSLIEQYDRLGVAAGTVEQSMGGFSNVLAEINRHDSSKRLEMIQAAQAYGEVMERAIERVEEETTTTSKLNEVLIQSQNVYDYRLKQTDNNVADATKAQNDFLKLWELDPVLKVMGQAKEVTEEDKKRFAVRAKATEEYRKAVADLSHEWEEFSADIKTSLLAADGLIVGGLKQMTELVKELHALWKDWDKKPTTGATLTNESGATVKDVMTHRFWTEKAGDPNRVRPGREGRPRRNEEVLPGFNDRWPTPEQQLKPLTKPTSPIDKRWPTPEQQFQPLTKPAQLLSGGVSGTQSDQIPGISKGWEWMRRSENIEDRRFTDNSLRQGDDYLKTVEANTAETKRLNDNFRLLDQGDVELKGLGGLPGFGGGGRYGGGGSTGAWGGGPNGSRVGPGVGAGASDSHPGGGKGGGTADEGGPVQLTDQSGKGIDSETMKDVEKLGRQGDVSGLQSLFAKRGYRMSGPACGIIASKYVESAGFKPAASGAIASSWHKWGEKLKPEDVNVPGHPFGSMVGTYWHRRYGGDKNEILAPGQTGGHVMTIIPGSYDAKSGTVDVVDQYGYSHGKRSVSDLDVRFAGSEAVAAAAAKRGEDRSSVDASAGPKSVRTVKVDINGKLTADVDAPKGANVKVEGGGAFNKTEMNRTMPLDNK